MDIKIIKEKIKKNMLNNVIVSWIGGIFVGVLSGYLIAYPTTDYEPEVQTWLSCIIAVVVILVLCGSTIGYFKTAKRKIERDFAFLVDSFESTKDLNQTSDSSNEN